MNNRHIAVFEQIVALDSLTLSSPKRGTRRKKRQKGAKYREDTPYL